MRIGKKCSSLEKNATNCAKKIDTHDCERKRRIGQSSEEFLKNGISKNKMRSERIQKKIEAMKRIAN